MCGRFSMMASSLDIKQRFGVKVEDEIIPNNNAAPGQMLPIILNQSPDRVTMCRWGLIPSWVRDKKISIINARAENIDEKPSFRKPFLTQRCLVIADGFYEWHDKIPYRITLKSEELFAFAGIWDRWKNPEGKEIITFSIITTAANELVSKIHDRMPVILKDEKAWLNRADKTLLQPYPADAMESIFRSA